MRSLMRTWLVLALGLALLPCNTLHAQAKKKANSKTVTFKTYDGVELTGTLYPNSAGKRDATVLLLHGFDHKKGGSRAQEGIDEIATFLQADGYAVLSFDFRGFGDSKTIINENLFWDTRKNPHNGRGYLKKSKGATLDFKDFNLAYYPYLVNDITAARAYLDRRNDANELNTSSLIVIGCGEGATLGAMWMAHEARRRRDKNTMDPIVGLPVPQLAEPEVKDVAAGIWFSISTTIGGKGAYLSKWLIEAGRANKVPQAFFMSKADSKGENLANAVLRNIKATPKLEKELTFTAKRTVAGGKLNGSSLLKLKDSQDSIKKYLNNLLEKRGNKERIDRKTDTYRYYYLNPVTKRTTLQKQKGDDVGWVDVTTFMTGK